MGGTRFGRLQRKCCYFLAGFVYPIVTHWAWDGNGWLYVGVDYTKDGVTRTVSYQVSCLHTLRDAYIFRFELNEAKQPREPVCLT